MHAWPASEVPALPGQGRDLRIHDTATGGRITLDPGPVARIYVCGITTNHCCETTARVGGNLGHDVVFAIDATHTFVRTGPDGDVVTADELARVTAANLHGEFATVVRTKQLLG